MRASSFQIPKGTQSHQRIKLVGKGIPRLNGYGKGDHYLHIKIYIPKYAISCAISLPSYPLCSKSIFDVINFID